jgi:hypothetical protein
MLYNIEEILKIDIAVLSSKFLALTDLFFFSLSQAKSRMNARGKAALGDSRGQTS